MTSVSMIHCFCSIQSRTLLDVDMSISIVAGRVLRLWLHSYLGLFYSSVQILRYIISFWRYMHDERFPGSDVDLFLYGMDADQARKKIVQIYDAVREAVPFEVLCFRSAHTITLVSEYPFRHIQIILRWGYSLIYTEMPIFMNSFIESHRPYDLLYMQLYHFGTLWCPAWKQFAFSQALTYCPIHLLTNMNLLGCCLKLFAVCV